MAIPPFLLQRENRWADSVNLPLTNNTPSRRLPFCILAQLTVHSECFFVQNRTDLLKVSGYFVVGTTQAYA
jgi:hypothetical protein